MTQALEKVPYVLSAKTEYKTKQSVVEAIGPTCTTEGEKQLLQAVDDIGYSAKVLSNEAKKP